jgi:hypothetical protein
LAHIAEIVSDIFESNETKFSPFTDESGVMDLNQLYFEHQIAVMRADGALSRQFRRDRRFDASRIAGRIGCMQRALRAGAAPAWEAIAARGAADLPAQSLALHAPGGCDGLAPPSK